MKIRLDRLYEGEHCLNDQISPGDLELDPSYFVEPVDLILHWDRRDPYIRMRFEIKTNRQSQCDRCLDDVKLVIDSQTELLVQLRDEVLEDLEDPDYKIVTPDNVEIDFTRDLRDAILLAVPVKILCNEDCKGLCVSCGANLNVESCTCSQQVVSPGWEALQKLKKDSI